MSQQTNTSRKRRGLYGSADVHTYDVIRNWYALSLLSSTALPTINTLLIHRERFVITLALAAYSVTSQAMAKESNVWPIRHVTVTNGNRGFLSSWLCRCVGGNPISKFGGNGSGLKKSRYDCPVQQPNITKKRNLELHRAQSLKTRILDVIFKISA